MRRTLTIALGTAVALVTAAVAFAVVPPLVGVHTATASFTTSSVEKLRKSDCTADAQTWNFTDGRYSGEVVSATEPLLAGKLWLHARTTYNATSKLGWVSGSFKIRDDDSRVSGKFTGTLSDGKLVGFLTGKSHGNHAKVLGNLSATFAGGDTQFADGQIGSASSGAVLAIVSGHPCKAEKGPKPPKEPKPAKRVRAEGTATLAGGPPPTSITVTPKHGPVTPPCTIPATFVLPVGVVTGAKVEMECEWTAPAVLTLMKVKLDK